MTFRPFGKDVQFSLSELQDEMNKVFNRLWEGGMKVNPFAERDFVPRVDIREEPERFVVTAEVPGVDISAIEVSFTEGTLTLRGQKWEGEFDDANWQRLVSERRYGSFTRAVPIPLKVEADRIAARCEAGVLEVVLPKSQTARPKTIKVQGGPKASA